MIRDGAKEVYEPDNGNGICTNAHVYFEIWPVVINALGHRFMTKNVLQEVHDVVTRSSQRPDENKPKFKTRLSKAKRQFGHMFTAKKRFKLYVRVHNPNIREEMMEKLQGKPPVVHSRHIDTRRIEAVRGRSQRA